jgi:hypothetical protein
LGRRLAFIRSKGGVRRIVRIDYIPADQGWQAGDQTPKDPFYFWGPLSPDDFTLNREA